ncbi:MAG: 1,4-dihydroxy-2-naphthoate octaprenyltransferase [Robiginitalea sp.]|uniref:1,4-dihydroxy-2-naphthoate octaprenyltransferase n=1 Tax=Robiginitalea sp. TaxID=1902411 RepID=UPI003C75080A
MTKLSSWVQAARLRTLPLSLSGILTGTALALGSGYSDMWLFLLMLATTVCYQVTSNFANDYGDGIKGTDNEFRIGPRRALQSGALSAQELRRGIWLSSGISAALTLGTLLYAFGTESLGYLLLFLLLGGAAIWASIKYTVGSDAYGYRGLGDVFVFLFFGLLSVVGSYFLLAHSLNFQCFLPAIAIGALSTGVLNLNNLRDHESDSRSGKRTLVVQMGYVNGVRYHIALCLLAFLTFLFYILLQDQPLRFIPCLIPFIPIGNHLRKVIRTTNPASLDPELKKLALSTFSIGLLLLAVNYYFS